MRKDIVDKLEDLRYKYLNDKQGYNEPELVQEQLDEIKSDIVFLIYVLQVLVDPFKDYSAEVK